jgi:hypothetical protein
MYFVPIENPESKELRAAFRGRALVGKSVSLPEKVTGVLVNDTLSSAVVSVISSRKESVYTINSSEVIPTSTSLQGKRPADSRLPITSSTSKYARKESSEKSSEEEGESEEEVVERKTFKFVPRQSFSTSQSRASLQHQGRTNSSEETEQVRIWSVDSIFDEVTVWAHDKTPFDGTCIASALDWIPISNAINDPIE